LQALGNCNSALTGIIDVWEILLEFNLRWQDGDKAINGGNLYGGTKQW